MNDQITNEEMAKRFIRRILLKPEVFHKLIQRIENFREEDCVDWDFNDESESNPDKTI